MVAEGDLHQSSAGISLEGLLRLVDMQVSATMVEYDYEFYIQRDGMCIRSVIATIVAEVCLLGLSMLM